MKGVLDFFNSALPWIGIGLGVAFSSVKMKAIKDGKKLGRIFNDSSWCTINFGFLKNEKEKNEYEL